MANIDVPVWENDGKKVLHRGRPVRGADPKTFEVLLGNYARDAKSVFFHSIQSKQIDRDTFRPLNANFCIDATQAFFVVTPIKDADPKTFRVLDSSLVFFSMGSFISSGYAADANSVWHASSQGIRRIKKAEPVTFFSLGNNYGCDRERVYFYATPIHGADRVTWRHWAGLLSIDKNNVYFTSKKIEGVDRPSIWLLTATDSFMDRHRIYISNRAVTPEEYLEWLKSVDEKCAWEREQIHSGAMFERIKSQHPDGI
ncbi:MAG: DKNYY domain-containing protein [Candidatus Hydrogenedentes bacterium]|nr:DKNYY domain-containing protein [Candidatus Hydrogenedentota bacterium]